jgi:hypothetical protein
MADPVDVVVSAFATPPESRYRTVAQDPAFFRAAPVIVDVPFAQEPGEWNASSGFNRSADQLQQQGGGKSILRPLLRRVRGATIRSVTLIGFSAGNQFLKRVLSLPEDVAILDTVISLDGMVFNNDWQGNIIPSDARPWMEFARLAASDKRMMVVASTDIPAPSKQITSTTGALSYVARELQGPGMRPPHYPPDVPRINDALTAGPPPPAVEMVGYRPNASGGRDAITRRWETMPLPTIAAFGNFWGLFYGGSNEADHIFIARYAQRAIWRTFLAPRRNAGQQCAIQPLSGLGADGTCERAVNLLPRGAIETESVWPVRALAAGGLIAGIALGTTIMSR